MSDGKLTLNDVSCDVETTPMPINTIVAPEDSITLEVQKVLSANKSLYSIGTATSVCLTCISVLVGTSEFKPFSGLSGEFWHGVFATVAAFSGAFTIFYAIKAALLHASLSPEAVVNALVARSKQSNVPITRQKTSFHILRSKNGITFGPVHR